MRLIAAIAFVCLSVFAQDGPTIHISQVGPSANYQEVYGYSGTNLTYYCKSRSIVSSGLRAQTIGSVSAATNGSPAVLTSTGHGFSTSSRPKVTISGGTGNWAAINGTFTATIIDANSFSIPVDSTTFGALAGTITYTTTAPRTNVAEWQVKMFFYDASSNLVWAGWLNGTSGFTNRCSDAVLTTTNTQ